MGDSKVSLAEICVYPLKGARGFRPETWPLGDSGLLADRAWMLVDPRGHCVTQLSAPRIALIGTAFDADRVFFTAPGLDATDCPFDTGPDAGPTEVLMEGGESAWASSIDTTMNEWFSAALRFECHLVRCSDQTARWVDGQVDQGAPLKFQKAFPLHLVSQASLDDLNRRLAKPVSMNRFRPNLTVVGTEPHEDDGWKRIRVGEVILQVGRACDHRCGLPNIDQQTSLPGVEQLKTLAKYRRSKGCIYFGQNVTIERAGVVRVGDTVSVLEPGEGLTCREARPGP